MPSILTGDDRAQLTTTLSAGAVVAEARVGGGIASRAAGDDESRQTLRLDAATLLSDRWQAALTLPWVRRSRTRAGQEATAAGLGDVTAGVTFEALPEWSYSRWKPKGFLFLSLTAPTGGSVHDSTASFRVDSRGRGFWSGSLGVLLMKTWGDWDVSLVAEAHRSLPRTIRRPEGDLSLTPGWGASTLFAVGISPGAGPLRLGVSLTPSFEEGVTTTGLVDGRGADQLLWTAAAQVGYLIDSELSASIVYSDDTLVGGASNAPLQRSVAFLLQKRWPR